MMVLRRWLVNLLGVGSVPSSALFVLRERPLWN
jgi:hypothetical protein